MVLVGPPKPPSPVPEGVEEPVSPATLGYRDTTSAGTAGTALRDQLGAAQARAACVSVDVGTGAGRLGRVVAVQEHPAENDPLLAVLLALADGRRDALRPLPPGPCTLVSARLPWVSRRTEAGIRTSATSAAVPLMPRS